MIFTSVCLLIGELLFRWQQNEGLVFVFPQFSVVFELIRFSELTLKVVEGSTVSSSLLIIILSLINTCSHTHTSTTCVSWVWHQHAHWLLFCLNDSQLSDAVVFAPPEFGMAVVQLLQLSPCCVLHMSCWSVRKPQISSLCRCLSLHWLKKVQIDYRFTTGQILSYFENKHGSKKTLAPSTSQWLMSPSHLWGCQPAKCMKISSNISTNISTTETTAFSSCSSALQSALSIMKLWQQKWD